MTVYQPADDREQLLLQWAVACGLYNPQYFRIDVDFAAVYRRVLRSLDDWAAAADIDHYMQALQWLSSVGWYL